MQTDFLSMMQENVALFMGKPKMAGENVHAEAGKRRARRRGAPGGEANKSDPAAVTIRCSRSGEWLAAGELWAAALEAARTRGNVTLDVAEMDHLDAGTLQILLALAIDRRDKGLSVQLVNASPVLEQWFVYAGAPGYLFPHSSGQL